MSEQERDDLLLIFASPHISFGGRNPIGIYRLFSDECRGALYPDSSLSDLYDEISMPPELRKAHTKNDKAVMQAYGFSIKDTTEESCVAELMKMYQRITST